MAVRIIKGDCRESLRKLAAGSVHCVVTSPPYWGLRSYGTPPLLFGGDPACEHEFADETLTRELRMGAGLEELSKRYRGGGKKAAKVDPLKIVRGACVRCGCWRGDLGLEPTPEMFVEHMVEVFREVRRVLRDDGTLWLNIGDCYATGPGGVGQHPGGGTQGAKWAGRPSPGSTAAAGRGVRRGANAGKHEYNGMGPMTQPNRLPIPGLKPKDLVGIPWRLAFALQADGWWLRQDIVWHKPNPMPESVEDRCTKAHEYLFLLTKSERYYYDAEAIKEQPSENSHPRGTKLVTPKSATAGSGIRANESFHASTGALVESRNKRSVWTIATRPFAEAHFATFPPALVEPCIKAGTSEKGCCSKCGKPFARMVQRGTAPAVEDSGIDRYGTGKAGIHRKIGSSYQKWLNENPKETVGFSAGCSCAGGVKPCVVLDPFGGSGTTAMVADRLGRDAVICELNPGYAEMAVRRINGDAGMFAKVAAE